MRPEIVTALVVGASIAAWLAFLGYLALGKKRSVQEETVADHIEGAKPAEGAPPYVMELETPEPRARPRRVEEEVRGITRRQFLNRAWLLSTLVALAQFGAASLDFLWPRLREGFGTAIPVGTVDDIRQQIQSTREPVFIADGRFWLTMYQGPPAATEDIPALRLANTAETGIVALYRKCPHLGCSVPWCIPSQWFECPCHGSKYSVNGEYRDGPAPRGMDRFRTEIRDGQVVVDTSTIIQGPPRGTRTSQPQPEGEHCVILGGE